jgi:hypothetical protein
MLDVYIYWNSIGDNYIIDTHYKSYFYFFVNPQRVMSSACIICIQSPSVLDPPAIYISRSSWTCELACMRQCNGHIIININIIIINIIIIIIIIN